LAPSVFHLFGPLKSHLVDKGFADDEEVEMEVRKWLRQQSKDLYAAGFDSLVERWDTCINVGGGYIDHSPPPSFECHISYVLYRFLIYILILLCMYTSLTVFPFKIYVFTC
jgi:hypothetical protein